MRSQGSISSETVRDFFVVGLRNAHAVENEALTLIDRQLGRIENYPDVAQRLREHRGETEEQQRRLETILESLGESHSALKDTALSLMGNMAAMGNAMAGDEIIKNTFANFAFENFEIASYRSLIAAAEQGGFTQAVAPLQASLREEQQMASWIEQNIPAITQRHIAREDRGVAAKR
jgi:ferritin-like metal-binding protein YciE